MSYRKKKGGGGRGEGSQLLTIGQERHDDDSQDQLGRSKTEEEAGLCADGRAGDPEASGHPVRGRGLLIGSHRAEEEVCSNDM